MTDLITVSKDLGRRLNGRTLFVVACGTDLELPQGFEVPFQETARYLDMKYGGAYYGQTDDTGPVTSALQGAAAFGDKLFS